MISEHLDVFVVKGDGMVPTFSIGDKLIVDKDDRSLASGVYIVDFGMGPEIKRVSPQAQEVILSTDNKTYAPFSIEPRKLKITGRVVARVSRV